MRIELYNKGCYFEIRAFNSKCIWTLLESNPFAGELLDYQVICYFLD